MDRFVTSTRVDPSGASSSKRKAPDSAWLDNYTIIENMSRNGMVVKCKHCKAVLKGSTTRLKAHLSSTKDMRAIRKMENVDLNAEYVADVQAMLLEQDNVHGIDSERSAGSITSESSDSEYSLSCYV